VWTLGGGTGVMGSACLNQPLHGAHFPVFTSVCVHEGQRLTAAAPRKRHTPPRIGGPVGGRSLIHLHLHHANSGLARPWPSRASRTAGGGSFGICPRLVSHVSEMGGAGITQCVQYILYLRAILNQGFGLNQIWLMPVASTRLRARFAELAVGGYYAC
jgi:hypothetical protein